MSSRCQTKLRRCASARQKVHTVQHTSSSIRTVTVGPGVAPGQRAQLTRPVADCTASGEFHPALKTLDSVVVPYYTLWESKMQPNLIKKRKGIFSEAVFCLEISAENDGKWWKYRKIYPKTDMCKIYKLFLLNFRKKQRNTINQQFFARFIWRHSLKLNKTRVNQLRQKIKKVIDLLQKNRYNRKVSKRGPLYILFYKEESLCKTIVLSSVSSAQTTSCPT